MPSALTDLKVTEVSFCKEGMNPHAKVALFKSKDKPEPIEKARLSLAKRTFEEALSAQLVSEKVSEVFWRAFENQWAVRDAFRTALTDEIAEGGDGMTATAAFTEAMQELATAAAEAARDAASTAETDLESAVEEAVSKWLQKHDQEQPMSKITTKAALTSAVAGFAIAKSTLADANSIVDAAFELDAVDVLDGNDDLANMAKTRREAEGNTEDLAKAKRDIAVLKMDTDTRAHFDGLDDAGQTTFLAKSADDQARDVAAANEADPIVFKSKDGAVTVRKSDGALAKQLAERQDALEAENADLRKAQTAQSVEAEAGKYPNVAKAVAVDMLKSADQVGRDTDAGKSILKSLTAMDAGAKRLFKSNGTTETGEPSGDVTKARQTFEAKVEEIGKARELGKADAMSAARTEHPDLYAEAYPEETEAAE